MYTVTVFVGNSVMTLKHLSLEEAIEKKDEFERKGEDVTIEPEF
jgi:hypothetical protein